MGEWIWQGGGGRGYADFNSDKMEEVVKYNIRIIYINIFVPDIFRNIIYMYILKFRQIFFSQFMYSFLFVEVSSINFI